jgi:hypothetical protein
VDRGSPLSGGKQQMLAISRALMSRRPRLKPPIAARGICSRSLQHSAGGPSCLAVFARFQAATVDWLVPIRTASSACEARPQASHEQLRGDLKFRSERVVTDVASVFARGGATYPLDVPR